MLQWIALVLATYAVAAIIGWMAYKLGRQEGIGVGALKMYDYYKKLEESRQKYYDEVNAAITKTLEAAYGMPAAPKLPKTGKLTVLKPEKGDDK